MKDIDVKKIRENLGMTQKEFAEMLNTSTQTIINYEKGTKIPATKYQIFADLTNGITPNILPKKNNISQEITPSREDLYNQIIEGLHEQKKLTQEIARLSKILDDNQINY